MTMLVATGCGGGGNAGGNVGQIELVSSTPAGQRPVDLVKWALSFGEPLSLDPTKAFGESEETVVSNLCEGLLRIAPDYSVQPGLATKADWTGPTTFVADLRGDVRFWDGTPLTADDVVYSMQRNLDPDVQSAYGYAYEYVDTIQKTGPLQVTVTFKQHDTQFRNAMASHGGAVVQKLFGTRIGKDLGTPAGGLMCTGPYRLVKWSPGDKITIAKNDGYRDGAPKAGTLEFQFLTDSATLTSALLAGQIDGGFNAPVASVNAFANSNQGKLLAGPSSMFVGFFPTASQGPAIDPKVRQALDLAINKDAFIKQALRGYGGPLKTMTPPIVWQSIPGHETLKTAYDNLPSHTQDLAKAKALIAEANPARKSLVFATKGGDALALQSATIVQSAARELGFDAELKTLQPTDFDAFFFDASKRASVDFVVTPGWIEVPGLFYYAPQYVLPNGFFNYTGYDKPQVTKLLQDARTSVDPGESARLFAEAQAIFTADGVMVPLAGIHVRVFLNNRLTGITTSSAFLTSAWAANLGGS
ncbi:ABC transporter substrate-binding protein [Kibdelosporangium banguiense]|nr:ABC transporter substrate-binding protein [Kibdelosporangium banguiense]